MSFNKIVTAYVYSVTANTFICFFHFVRSRIMYGSRKLSSLVGNLKFLMGVSITQYRHAIGCFNPIGTTRNRIYTSTIIDNYIKGNNSCSPFDNILIVLYFIFIFYALVFLEVSCVCLTDTNMIIIQHLNILYYHMYGIPSYSFLLNNNFLYLILICRTSKNQNSIKNLSYSFKKV